MITVENDYGPFIYEQPTQTAQEVNENNTVIKPDEKGKTQCSNTNHI